MWAHLYDLTVSPAHLRHPAGSTLRCTICGSSAFHSSSRLTVRNSGTHSSPLGRTPLAPERWQRRGCGAGRAPLTAPSHVFPRLPPDGFPWTDQRFSEGLEELQGIQREMWTFSYRVTTPVIQGKSPRRSWAPHRGPLGVKPQFLVPAWSSRSFLLRNFRFVSLHPPVESLLPAVVCSRWGHSKSGHF